MCMSMYIYNAKQVFHIRAKTPLLSTGSMIRGCEGYCFVLDSYSNCLKSCLAALLGRINPGRQISLSVCSLLWGLVGSM